MTIIPIRWIWNTGEVVPVIQLGLSGDEHCPYHVSRLSIMETEDRAYLSKFKPENGVINYHVEDRKIFDKLNTRLHHSCDRCGISIIHKGSFQIFFRELYTDGNGWLSPREHAPHGAVWEAPWYGTNSRGGWCKTGKDGRVLVCRTPGGDWVIDSRATNCTLPEDNEHSCWVRHGRPENGSLHVGKEGLTCSAGDGSINLPNWHGFLHNGKLEKC